MRLTYCECTSDGWCRRHDCFKSRGMFLMCSRSVEAFQQWEAGQGLQQNNGHSKLDVLKTPCLHRSADPFDEIQCEYCGANNRMVPVYACDEFGECTQFPTGGRSERAELMQSCVRCNSYRPRNLAPEKQESTEAIIK